jgi:two-component system cell cycle sensor histidine kinase/response regulator CckA
MRGPLGIGIRGKLLLSFSALVAAISVFVTMFFPSRVERHVQAQIIENAKYVRSTADYGVSAGLYFDDRDAIAAVIEGVASNGDVRWVIVRDSTGAPIAVSGISSGRAAAIDEKSEFMTPDGLEYVSSEIVKHNLRRVGSITVATSLADLRTAMHNARRGGAFMGVGVFAAGCILVLVISTLITRPLREVVRTARQIADGNLTLRAAEPWDAEVGELVRAFNTMVGSVAESQQLLAGLNHDLEARVAKRTAQLTDAVAMQVVAQQALAGSEAQARATSELLQSLIDVAPQVILTVDVEWRVTRWNKAAERLFGWTAAEVLGKPVPYVAPEDQENADSIRRQMRDDQRVEGLEVLRVRKDGTRIPVLLSSAAILDRNRVVTGYIGILMDLTERKSLEDQLRQSQKMEAIGRLAGGVAHDFNNILTIITATTSLLLDAEERQDRRNDLDEVLTAAKRAAALTRQLLTFSRQGFVQLESVTFDRVVRDMDPMLRRLLPTNIEIDLRLCGSDRTVKADSSQLQQVVLNLAVNSFDAMPSGGKFTLTTEIVHMAVPTPDRPAMNPGDYVMVTARDTGVGMDATTKQRVFEPFFTTKGIGKGTGLGLSTVYAVVSNLGGDIHVDSAPGEGATFTIHLPLEEGTAEPAEAQADAQTTTAGTEGGIVLLVEDEANVRAAVRRTLNRSGFTVLEAPGGRAALDLVASTPKHIDVVLTDVMMPGMDGRSLVEALHHDRPELHVVFMSGYSNDAVRDKLQIDALHSYLQKPFTPEALLHAIRNSMRIRGLSHAA